MQHQTIQQHIMLCKEVILIKFANSTTEPFLKKICQFAISKHSNNYNQWASRYPRQNGEVTHQKKEI